MPHDGQIGVAAYECRPGLCTRTEGKDIGGRGAILLVGNPVAVRSVGMQGQGEDITTSRPYNNATALPCLFDDHYAGKRFDKLCWEIGRKLGADLVLIWQIVLAGTTRHVAFTLAYLGKSRVREVPRCLPQKRGISAELDAHPATHQLPLPLHHRTSLEQRT